MSKKKNHRHNKHKEYLKYSGAAMITSLCESCRKLGYCREGRINLLMEKPIEPRWEKALTRPVNFNLKYYCAKIPLRVPEGTTLNEFGRKHLQIAYDAFHQDDFETALLNYKCIDHGGAYNNQPDYFLALTFFLLGNYENAVAHMQACIDNTYFATEDFTPFLEECERRFRVQTQVKTSACQTMAKACKPGLITVLT